MKNFLKRILFFICFPFVISATAQMNRSTQANNITSNIFQNNTHAITGSALQGVMLNQNNSYVNLLSDTNLLDVRNFSSFAIYTPGMACFHGDTLYENIITTNGAWNKADWINISGTSLGCFIPCSDTGTAGDVITRHSLSLLTSSLIPFSDTNTLIYTKYDGTITDASLVKYSDTGSGTTYPKIATPYWVAIHSGGLTGTTNFSSPYTTALGYGAGVNTASTGSYNTAVGLDALNTNTVGFQNTCIGAYAGNSGTNTQENTYLGVNAARYGLGNLNVGIGDAALESASFTGSGNVAIGNSSGYHNTSGTYNTFLGYQADANAGTYTNSTAIGNGATITASNQIVFGNSSVTSLVLPNTNGSGTAPSNTTTPVAWEIVTINGNTYYIPLYQ